MRSELEKAPGLWHAEAGRLSLTKLKEVLANVCVVTCCAGRENVLDRVHCTCLYYQKTSRCSHMAFAAFLQGHCTEYFQELIEFAQKGGPDPDPVKSVKLERKMYSRASVPSAAAWKRMAQICSEASEKYRQRKKAKTGSVMESTPQKECGQEPQEAGERTAALELILGKLGAKDFHANFAGMHLCVKHGVTVVEAQNLGLGKLVLDLKKKTTSGPTRKLAEQLLNGWVAEHGSGAAAASSVDKSK